MITIPEKDYSKVNSPSKLLSVEYARGFAAFLVLLVHVSFGLELYFHDSTLLHIFSIGHVGVDFFFVLSGFIILYVNQHNLGDSSWIREYFKRRLTRIYPIYWCVFFIMATWHLILGHVGEDKAYPWINLIKCFFLFPLDTIPGVTIVGAAWTLPFELIFYATFVLFFVNKLAGSLVFTTWMVFIFANNLSDRFFSEALVKVTGLGFLSILLSPYIVEFILGMMGAYLFLNSSKKTVCYIIGTTTLVSIGFLLYTTSHSNTYINGLFFFSVLLGIVSLEKYKGIASSEFFLLLGRASYAIYLTHMSSIQLCMRPLSDLNPHMNSLTVFMLTILVALTIGVWFHLYIELPLQGFFKKNLSKKQLLDRSMV
jgi:exopolysaccharide production protein ExoZ